jgi:hypothetical protein
LSQEAVFFAGHTSAAVTMKHGFEIHNQHFSAALLFFLSFATTLLEYGSGSTFQAGRYSTLVEKMRSLKDDFNTTIPTFAKHFRKSRRSHRVPSYGYVGGKSIRIDLSPYSSVLTVDKTKKTVMVESGCHIEALIDACLKEGLIPKVLPEFRDITVGGAIVGTALEASSFRWGQFNDICREIHVLCGDGSIQRCSRDHNDDLWHALPGSYGTLGTVLCAEIECIDAKELVLVTIQSFERPSDALKAISDSSRDSSIEFIEALQFPPETPSSGNHNNVGSTAVITGRLVAATSTSNSDKVEMFRVSNPTEEFYYERIQREARELTRRGPSTQKQFMMSLKDFLFRYDRGAFWMARPTSHNLLAMLRTPLVLPAIIMSSNNPVSRFLFRWVFTTGRLYSMLHKAHPLVVRNRMVVMDVRMYTL